MKYKILNMIQRCINLMYELMQHLVYVLLCCMMYSAILSKLKVTVAYSNHSSEMQANLCILKTLTASIVLYFN